MSDEFKSKTKSSHLKEATVTNLEQFELEQ